MISVYLFDNFIGDFTFEEVVMLAKRNKDIEIEYHIYSIRESLIEEFEHDSIVFGVHIAWTLEEMISDFEDEIRILRNLGFLYWEE